VLTIIIAKIEQDPTKVDKDFSVIDYIDYVKVMLRLQLREEDDRRQASKGQLSLATDPGPRPWWERGTAPSGTAVDAQGPHET
jgi:hypothetical protein